MSDRFFDVSAFVYAHRGLWSNAAPENSLTAFAAARTAQVGVELDVRLTADRVPVVFHDADLERMCGHRDLLARLTLDELAQHRLPNGSRIPTLDQVLNIMGELPVLIELKVDGTGGGIAQRVAETIAAASGRLAVMSFDEPTVAQLCRLVTARPVGLLAIGGSQADIEAKARAARAMGCDYVAPHHSALPAMAGAAGGLPMVAWTVRTADELALSRTFGAAPIFEGISADLAKSSGTPI